MLPLAVAKKAKEVHRNAGIIALYNMERMDGEALHGNKTHVAVYMKHILENAKVAIQMIGNIMNSIQNHVLLLQVVNVLIMPNTQANAATGKAHVKLVASCGLNAKRRVVYVVVK